MTGLLSITVRTVQEDRRRMAQVATVYTVRPNPRTAESVMNLDKKDNVVKFRPPVRNKRVFASLERTPEQVIEETFDEAIKRDPEKKRQWVIVLDGHPHQLKLVERVLKRKQVKATIVMDFIHVLEYLWKAAYCLHEKGSEAAENWVRERALRVLQGQACNVAKNKSRLCYDVALVEGLPIASGVIEGACRHLINDRMDISGARWSLQGAEAVLKLRSIRSSGDWGEYWKYHLTRSELRNHGELLINEVTS